MIPTLEPPPSPIRGRGGQRSNMIDICGMSNTWNVSNLQRHVTTTPRQTRGGVGTTDEKTKMSDISQWNQRKYHKNYQYKKYEIVVMSKIRFQWINKRESNQRMIQFVKAVVQ